MNAKIFGCLTERHLMLFGTIVQWFAHHELLMQKIVAKVIGTDTAAVMLLTRSLTFDDKRDALLDLLRHRNIPLDQFDVVHNYLMIPHTLSRLCDDIEHAAWIAGPSRNSIQPDWVLRPPPTVKPMHKTADPRSGSFIEDYADRVEYTLDDLAEAVETLSKNYGLFSDYVREVGLIDKG